MEDSPLQFAHPLWLYASLPLCALAAWLLIHLDRRRHGDLAKLVHPRFRQQLAPGFSKRLTLTKRALWLATLFFLLLTAAGPRKGFEFREVKRRGIDLLFAVDTSRSMLAQDLSPNRLERAKLGIQDFVNRLEGDRVGLIPFAGSAYALCPLTNDYDAFHESLNAIDTDLIPQQGTDVASAIREASVLFDEQTNNHRILILITDGEDFQGDVLEVAQAEAKKGMTIYPVGVGSAGGQTIPYLLPNGRMDVIRDESGNPVTTKLDEPALQSIAKATNGFYVPLGRGAEGLDTIYREKLRLVPKTESDARMEKIPLERFRWTLIPAILCLLMEFLLPDRRRPSTPAPLPSAARRTPLPARAAAPLLATLAAAASFLLPTGTARAGLDPHSLYNQGAAAYENNNFQGAADLFKSALATTDLAVQSKSYYNLGNSHYRIGQSTQAEDFDATVKSWEDAIKAYRDALQLDPDNSDARYNIALVEKKLEKLRQQHPEEDKKNQEQKKEQEKNKEQEKKDEQEQKDKEKQDGKDGEKGDKADQKDAGNPDKNKKSEDGGKQDGDAKDGEKKPGEKGDGKPGESKDGSGQEPGSDPDKSGKQPGEKGDQPGNDPDKKPGDPAGSEEGKEGQEKNPDGTPKKSKDGKEQGEGKPGDPKKSASEDPNGKSTSEQRQAIRQMTPEEAQQLIEMMRQEKRTVIPLPRPQQQQRGNYVDPNNATKGKTW